MTTFNKKFMRVPSINLSDTFKEISRNAYVDWLFVLLLSAIIVSSLVFNGYYIFWQIYTGSLQVSNKENSGAEKTFSEKDLDYVTSLFQTKADNLKNIKSNNIKYSDPSL